MENNLESIYKFYKVFRFSIDLKFVKLRTSLGAMLFSDEFLTYFKSDFSKKCDNHFFLRFSCIMIGKLFTNCLQLYIQLIFPINAPNVATSSEKNSRAWPR